MNNFMSIDYPALSFLSDMCDEAACVHALKFLVEHSSEYCQSLPEQNLGDAQAAVEGLVWNQTNDLSVWFWTEGMKKLAIASRELTFGNRDISIVPYSFFCFWFWWMC